MNPRYTPIIALIIVWGLWAFLPKLAVGHINPKSALFYHAIGGFLVAMVVLWMQGFKPEFHPVGSGIALLTGVLGIAGSLLYYIIATREKASVLASLNFIYPALAIFLAVVILKEVITLKQGAGMVLAMLSLVLLI